MIPPLLIEKLTAAVITKTVAAAWDRATRSNWETTLAGITGKWQQDFQSPEAGEEKLNAAFEEFFCRPPVLGELGKLGSGQYGDISLGVLAEQLRESFDFADCPAPETDLEAEINGWIVELRNTIERNPQFRRDHSSGVQEQIRGLRGAQAVVENHELARKKYLASVNRLHRSIRFSGMAVVDKTTEVEMAKVFVMPRVTAESIAKTGGREEPKPEAAYKLLENKKGRGGLVILGGPGSGKTTLLEAFALAFAGEVRFPWSPEAPKLLPIFYRIRDFDKDRKRHRTLWDAIHEHCSEKMGERLPHEFFRRQMETGGLLVLLDGLDEAGSVASRNEIVDLIGAFGDSLNKDSRMIITSRPYDYRHRFESYPHFELCEFDDDEIQTFIRAWQRIHEPDQTAAAEKGGRLWKALEERKEDILPLARNALLLTMIVRVHFGLGALPDSRLNLYQKCTETLLEHWATWERGDKEREPSPLSYSQKHKLLQRLAFEMQGEAERLSPEIALQISRGELAKRFFKYLKEDGCPDAFDRVEKVIRRLHARDAILVQFGIDEAGESRFGFVHRSFQEYFAACWMAQEMDDATFRVRLIAEAEGWNETLYLAVAQRQDRERRPLLLDLLKRGRAEFAVECLKAAPREQDWLRLLVQFLARYTRGGREYAGLTAAECADACGERPETAAVLKAMFERENREGQTLAAAVELAEELALRGDAASRILLDAFFGEGVGCAEDMVEVKAGGFPFGKKSEFVDLAAFTIDRYPVTNLDYERMIPGHRMLRNWASDADDQPVIYANWYEARLYCRWRGGGCRLPTEQEWEKAAGWDRDSKHKRVYPWGDVFEVLRCNTYESKLNKTSPVKAHPEGRSAYGCEDMAGNVFEWTDSWWSEGSETRVMRGGSWHFNHDSAACAYRGNYLPDIRYYVIGFRCART